MCVCSSFIQIAVNLSTYLKNSHIALHKFGCDGAVAFNVQCRLGRSVDILSVGHIVPAHELITRRRGRHYLISIHGALGIGISFGYCSPVHGIGAVFGGLECHSGIHITNQSHIGHGYLGGGTGTAGLNVNLD